MAVSNPFHRLWRPVKGYKWTNTMFYKGGNPPSIGYLYDDRFANQSERGTLVLTANLIIRDLYEIFNYIEPIDANVSTYSHRIYELFLRAATEFESNCKGILRENGYAKSEKAMSNCDYFKIAKVARLSEYRVSFVRWNAFLMMNNTVLFGMI